MARGERARRVALAGNPNAGKTSIFNALTGSRQHVGNYPGVTVEKRSGHYQLDGVRFEVVDLPGTYSLASHSPEERIAQDELLAGDFDVVVVVVDSTNLKRSLVLLTQVMQIGANPILCLNMADEARAAGQRVDLEQMETLLGFPVLETVGHQAAGIVELKRAIAAVAREPPEQHRLVLGERLDRAIAEVRVALEPLPFAPAVRDWLATKLLAGDEDTMARVTAAGDDGADAVALAGEVRTRLEAETGLDTQLYVTERHFGFVDGLLLEVLTKPARRDARALSDAIDAVVVQRWLGLPIFAVVMYAIFWFTFTLGEPPMSWIEGGFQALGGWLGGLWPAQSDSPLKSLLVDGIIGGVGGVVVFLPNIVLLFLGLGLLEDTGYMARAAFLMDRVMHRFGLHGKSFVPMMTGFGCSIPGILATRTLENERDRLTTMLVLPLMSCGARLPIWLLIIPAFFPPAWRAPVLWAVYAIGIVLALLLALLLRRTLLAGEEAPFVMELPPYRLPTVRALWVKIQERSWLYLRKAGTVILGISIVMWFVTTYPKPASYEIDARIAAGQVVVAAEGGATSVGGSAPAEGPGAAATREAASTAATATAPSPGAATTAAAGAVTLTRTEVEAQRSAEALRHSVAGRFGLAVEPVVRPLGFDWKLATAMVGALAAKEVFVAQVGIVYSMSDALARVEGGAQGPEPLRRALRRDYSLPTAISLVLFLLIAAPCMATVAATRRESNSWRWALGQFFGLTVIGYLLALVAYQIANLVL